jgi:hypothetical protein
MGQQVDINERMRSILIDWLIEVYIIMSSTKPMPKKAIIEFLVYYKF